MSLIDNPISDWDYHWQHSPSHQYGLCEKVEIQNSSPWPKTHVWHGSGTDSTTTNQFFLFQMYCGNRHTLTVTKSGAKDHLLKHPWQEERGAHIWTALSALCQPEKELPNRDCTALIHAQEMLSTDRFSAVTISRKRQCNHLGPQMKKKNGKKTCPKGYTVLSLALKTRSDSEQGYDFVVFRFIGQIVTFTHSFTDGPPAQQF